MAIKKFKPTTPSLRYRTVVDFRILQQTSLVNLWYMAKSV